MAVIWSDAARLARLSLLRELALRRPHAARALNLAIRQLVDTFATADYQRLPNGQMFAPVAAHTVIVIYERDAAGNVLIAHLCDSRSNWRPR